MEFLQKNARTVIIGLLVAGVVAGVSLRGSSNDEAPKETTSSETANQEEQQGPIAPESNESAPEQKTESTVERVDDNTSTVTAVKGDNQTTMVRKVVQQFVDGSEEKLSAEQLLFAETSLVDMLPRNDLIFVGDTVRLTDEQVSSVAEKAKNLTDSQIAAWAKYL